MKSGEDKRILEALALFDSAEMQVGNVSRTDGLPLDAPGQAIFGPLDGPGQFTWTHPCYPEILRKMTEAMELLGYHRGKQAQMVADAYICGYVRGVIEERENQREQRQCIQE